MQNPNVSEGAPLSCQYSGSLFGGTNMISGQYQEPTLLPGKLIEINYFTFFLTTTTSDAVNGMPVGLFFASRNHV